MFGACCKLRLSRRDSAKPLQEELTEQVRSKIKAAALDVLTNEQNLNFKSNKLINYFKQNENLIITPHIAGLTYESENIAFEIAYKNLKLS